MLGIIEKLEKKKKMLGYLNPANNQEIMTPSKLVEEVLDKLPVEVWSLENRFCDPAIKSGIFLLEVGIRLLKQFGEDKYKYIIDNCLYGFCVSKRAKILVESCFGAELKNVEVAGIEEIKKRIEIMPKFDVVIGNPPYQDGSKLKGNKLWPLFIKLATDIVKSSGIVAFITPNSWTSGGQNIQKGKFGALKDVFSKKQLLYVNLSKNVNKKYFSKIGISIGWWIFKNCDIIQKTEFVFDDGEILIDLNGREIITSEQEKISVEIINKILSSNCEKINSYYFNQYFSKGQYNETSVKTDVNKYQYWLIGSDKTDNLKTIYINEDLPSNVKYNKILFPSSSRYWQPYYADENMNVAAVGYAIKLDGNDTKDGSYSVFYSKLFTYLCFNLQIKVNGFMKTHLVRNLPKLDMSRVWSDAELYEYFNLTEEEINYIEKN